VATHLEEGGLVEVSEHVSESEHDVQCFFNTRKEDKHVTITLTY